MIRGSGRGEEGLAGGQQGSTGLSLAPVFVSWGLLQGPSGSTLLPSGHSDPFPYCSGSVVVDWGIAQFVSWDGQRTDRKDRRPSHGERGSDVLISWDGRDLRLGVNEILAPLNILGPLGPPFSSVGPV